MRIKREETIALFVDFQERMMPVITDGEAVIRRSVILLEGLKALDVPVVFLHQYPKGLGEIVPEIQTAAGDFTPLEKTSFSALGDEKITAEFERLRAAGIKNVLVCGVESHICVLQSCIDLVAAGFHPVMVADCVGSRNPYDREIGLRRAQQEGVLLTTVESILFELCERSGTEEFKAISKLVK